MVFSGHIIYPADALEQVIELTDMWWPTIGPKETLIVALTNTQMHLGLVFFL